MNDGKTRILHVVGRFGVGGYERQQAELIKRLPSERYTQTVATMEKSGPFLAEVEERGIEVIEFPFTSFYNRNAFRQYRALARLVRDRKIQIAHCHEFYSVIFGTVGCRLGGLRKIVVGRGNMGDQHSRMQRTVQMLCYKLDAAIIPNALMVKKRLIEHEGVPARKMVCIHNGIDIERFHPRPRNEELAASLGIPPGARVMGIVGTMRALKDHKTFLRAGAIIRRQFPDVHLLLVGGGELRADLERLAEELSIAQATTFAGERSDVPDLLALMNVFILTSETEGLPNAVLEAMATGLPVVATSVGGVPELVLDGETGYLIPVHNPELLAEKVMHLLGEPKLAETMGATARAMAVERFSCERFVAEMELLYQRVIAGEPPGKES